MSGHRLSKKVLQFNFPSLRVDNLWKVERASFDSEMNETARIELYIYRYMCVKWLVGRVNTWDVCDNYAVS